MSPRRRSRLQSHRTDRTLARPALLTAKTAGAVVALVTFVSFLPALRADFVAWDDQANFLNNYGYRGLGLDHLRWMWSTTHMGHYIPLSWMTLGLDYTLWGMNPAGYHTVNLLLHCLNAVLIFHLGRQLYQLTGLHPAAHDGERARNNDQSITIAAALSALFYAVHPLRVESVAWITERRDMLSLAFYLTSVLCYLAAVGSGREFTKKYVLSLAAFVAALLSKGTAVTLPVALFVLNVYPLKRLRRARDAAATGTHPAVRVLSELAPFTLLSLLAGMIAVRSLTSGTPLPIAQKAAVSVYSLGFYLWKTLVPVGLSPLYEMPLTVKPLSAAFLGYYCVALAFVAVAVWAWIRARPGIAAAAAAFVLITLPLLGVVQNGPQIAADRYTYHSSVALALLFGVPFLWSPARARLVAMSTAIYVLAVLTWQQTGIWRDSDALWTRALAVDSASSFAHNNYGVLLAQQGKSAEAIEQYRRAIAERPIYIDAMNNLGYELEAQGDYSGAVAQFRSALAINPRFADAEVNWGNALFAQNELEEAITHYRRAVGLQPSHPGGHLNWGVTLASQGKYREAVEQFRLAVTFDPGSEDARRYLEQALRQSNEMVAPAR